MTPFLLPKYIVSERNRQEVPAVVVAGERRPIYHRL